MSATRYGPGDTWPSHDKQHWRERLAEARQAGWTLTYLNAPHLFGVVTCPGGECRFNVDKTARNSETKAREASKRIHWCEHPPPGLVKDQQGKSQMLLQVAEGLTSEAARGLDQAEAKQLALKELDRLEIQLITAAANVEEVMREQEEALLAAIAVDSAPDPPILTEKLDMASSSVEQANSVAKSIGAGRPGVARPLMEQADKLRKRIGALQVRLAALQEPM